MNRLLHWLLTHPVGQQSHADSIAAEPSMGYAAEGGTVRVDVQRMQGALGSQTFEVTPGLSREEKRQQILAAARRQR